MAEVHALVPATWRGILTQIQITKLRAVLAGRLIVLCFGAGVDSTAMLIALRIAGIRPHVITFADTGNEKPETMLHLARVQRLLQEWGWPYVDVCIKRTLATTAYTTLYGNCWENETLPSLAFGLKSCSIKWKQDPQDQLLRGAVRGPNARPPHPLWIEAKASGQRIAKLIGYDCGKADMRRGKKAKTADAHFDYLFPLQLIKWTRVECVSAIMHALGKEYLPIKSACFFCPASKPWELYWLAGAHPELFEDALALERRALTGRHSRFDVVEFGATWEEMVRNADSFPSTNTCVGLGRSFAWNQWARVNNVVDEHYQVRRDKLAYFLFMADLLRSEDNALDARSATKPIKIIKSLKQSAAGRKSATTTQEESP